MTLSRPVWLHHEGRYPIPENVSAVKLRDGSIKHKVSGDRFMHGGVWDWHYRAPKGCDIIAYVGDTQ